jgi:hypothetical protein
MPSISYLGTISDPYFGTTTAEFVSQLRLGAEWTTGSYTIDSMKLFLKLLTVKGDTMDQHYLRLSEIANRIYDTATYYSGLPVALAGYTVPDILLPVLDADTINDIVVDVDTTFGRYLIRNQAMLTYSETADFRDFFKGLHFQLISPDDPVFVSMSIAMNQSGYYANYIVLYMHDKSDVTTTYSFRIDAASANAGFNLYKHDLKLEHINDTSYLDNLSYAQTFNGVYTKLILTNLDSIKNDPDMKNISVNKARLKIPVYYDNETYSRTTIPSTLYLRYLTSTGSKYLVPETGTAFYDGTADTTSTSEADDVYNLNIASFVQGFVEDTTNKLLPELELFLLPSAGHNVILKANGNQTPVKFEFTYTKF